MNTKAALDLRLSIIPSRCAVSTTSALSFEKAISDSCFTCMSKFLFLQPQVCRYEVLYDCIYVTFTATTKNATSFTAP